MDVPVPGDKRITSKKIKWALLNTLIHEVIFSIAVLGRRENDKITATMREEYDRDRKQDALGGWAVKKAPRWTERLHAYGKAVSSWLKWHSEKDFAVEEGDDPKEWTPIHTAFVQMVDYTYKQKTLTMQARW